MIVGSMGSQAFTPNPIQTSSGDMIVWKNSDSTIHHIVLDDGSDIGEIVPGASSDPMPLNSPIGYHCIIHPSMVGSLNGVLASDPPPPMPDYPPPYDGYYSIKQRKGR